MNDKYTFSVEFKGWNNLPGWKIKQYFVSYLVNIFNSLNDAVISLFLDLLVIYININKPIMIKFVFKNKFSLNTLYFCNITIAEWFLI